MNNVLTPPSAALLPATQTLRERLAVALREVDLLRRLIRAAESVHESKLTIASDLNKSAGNTPVTQMGCAHAG